MKCYIGIGHKRNRRRIKVAWNTQIKRGVIQINFGCGSSICNEFINPIFFLDIVVGGTKGGVFGIGGGVGACVLTVFVAFFSLQQFVAAVKIKCDVSVSDGRFAKIITKFKFVVVAGICINGVVGMQVRVKSKITA